MAKYNGHKNWNHWNVSLWLSNDEKLYGLMLNSIRLFEPGPKSKEYAAGVLLDDLKEAGLTHTPDGAPYTLTSIRAAMRYVQG